MTVEQQLAALQNKVAQLEQRQKPTYKPGSIIESFVAKLERLQRLRQSQAHTVAPTTVTKVYVEAGYGVRAAEMGLDFADIQQIRRQYAQHLRACGLNPSEADSIEHAWDLAAHRHDPPTDQACAFIQAGRGFLQYAQYAAVLDVTNQQQMKIYDHYVTTVRSY
jgi:hypothetical protein